MTPEPDRIGSATELATASERWSPARFDEEAASLAERIRRAWGGDGPPRIAHRFGLAPAAVVAIHAVARAEARLAPVHPGWDGDQVARFLDAVDPDLLLTEAGAGVPGSGWSAVDAGNRAAVDAGNRAAVDAGNRAGVDAGSRAGVDAGSRVPAATGIRLFTRVRDAISRSTLELPAGTDVLLSTSGTTGRPRIVCHSWDALRANAVAAACRNGFGPGDTWLATLAWAHVGGLAVVVRAAVVGGRIAFGPSRFDPADVATALRHADATHVSLVPAMLHAILDRGGPPPSSLHCALVGGAATPPALARHAVDGGWPVALTYGLTEMGSQVATGEPGEVSDEPGVVGPPLEGVELRTGPGGEIETRGPSRSLGEPGSPLPRAAWLSTGDLGTLDATGRLRVTGRRADRIVTGGANVDPAEVEAVLAGHPDVREVCVVGTSDDVWGEIVTAVVVTVRPPPAARADAPPGLREWAENRLSGPRRPRRWWWVESLPRVAGGKVDRARVRHLASEGRIGQ